MNMNLTLKIWRQKDAKSKGQMVEYKVTNISDHMSFLEMLDILNEQLIEKGEEPVAFDHDCREGICGMCSLFINGEAHGPDRGKIEASPALSVSFPSFIIPIFSNHFSKGLIGLLSHSCLNVASS